VTCMIGDNMAGLEDWDMAGQTNYGCMYRTKVCPVQYNILDCTCPNKVLVLHILSACKYYLEIHVIYVILFYYAMIESIMFVSI
jgi:hypothetical protein